MRTSTKMKVVHLFPNEPKFFRGAVSFFAPLEWSEKWLIRCKNEELDVFQSMAPEANIQRFSSAFQLDASQDGVIVHYLDLEMAEWILKIRKDIPVYIQTWGGRHRSTFGQQVAVWAQNKRLLLREVSTQCRTHGSRLSGV